MTTSKRGRPSAAPLSLDEALSAEAFRIWFERAWADGGARLISPDAVTRFVKMGYSGRTLQEIRKLLNARPVNEFVQKARGNNQGNKEQPGSTQVFSTDAGTLVLKYPRDGNRARLAAQLALHFEQAGDLKAVASAMLKMPEPKPDLRTVKREFKKLRNADKNAKTTISSGDETN